MAITGGGDDGRGITEGARVDVGSLGVAINVAKILAMLWISCNYSLPILEKGVKGEGVVSAEVRERAVEIAWSVEEACGTGHSWGKNWTVLEIISEQVLGMYTLWQQ